uniref:GB1/RHD3-type G domain-containing protein n=2 Tax=Plectus sambesii TaxID=2011161 RepID=A0A914WVA0_9BILA
MAGAAVDDEDNADRRSTAVESQSATSEGTETESSSVAPASMATRPNIRPLQVLALASSSSTRFVLNEEALKRILCDSKVANRKVVVISVAGAFRKGKSFLLNFFLEYLYSLSEAQEENCEHDWLSDEKQLRGFHWKAGAHRDTSGMWMWGEPILIRRDDGEKVAVVLVDTQGTFDNASTYRQCTTIFALSTMISSVQIYNIVDTIQEDSLQNLSLFVEYGRLATKESGDSYRKPFQTLVFLIRDFKSPDDYPYGKEGGTALLNDVLKVTKDQEPELRDVREQIKNCFDKILCYLLPHPGFKVSERISFKGHVRDIRPAFKNELEKLVPDLLNPTALEPKEINGKIITCKKLLEYFREYARTFDGNTLPEPRSILNANAQLICMEAMIEAKAFYCRGMEKACSGRRMMSEKRLEKIHLKQAEIALQIYEQSPKIGAGDIRDSNLAKLQTEIDSEYEMYRRANYEKRIKGVASACLACGDSPLLGIGLGAATVASTAGAAIAINVGVATAGIVAIPCALVVLFSVWILVCVQQCYETKCNRDE